MKVLLIEDDVNLSKDLRSQLELNNIEVDIAYDGVIAERIIQKANYDCILADINIPGKNGYDLIKSIRLQQISVPVIMLTAFGEIEDKLKGFDCGADDYITKPFFFEELLARMKVILKRNKILATQRELIVIKDLVIDLRKREVSRNSLPVKLTPREYEILVMLAEANGNTVSKKEILNIVWGSSFGANTNTIEVFINLLRNKIDKNFEVKLIKTRIGFGYSLGEN